MESPRDKSQPLFGWAPGDYLCKCYCCATKFLGDKRAIQCHPCALALLDQRIAEGKGATLDAPDSEEAKRLVEDFAKRWNERRGKPPGTQTSSRPEIESRPALDNAPLRPKVGQTVRIGARVGMVCAPNDPRRSGTYSSDKYGDIPVRWLGSRKERRAQAAMQRKARSR